MSRDAQVGDEGGNYRHRPDSLFISSSVSIRDLDNPEPIRHFLGPPISSIRRLSFTTNTVDDDDQDHETLSHRRQLVTEIAREATGLVEEVHGIQNDTSPTPATTHARNIGAMRRWPTRDVTDENIDECYVNFILCCNPAVPDSCDTAELRRSFRTPPKSDGVMFSVFKLYQLIKRFEEGDIKTWIQLVTELGVERKQDQSAQKVQQYAVRLKRWMHAMHIDAFFEYCLNRLHVYYTDIPPTLPSLDDELRDGVPLEEDLALRALMLEYRPKRGRRKMERTSIDSGFLGQEDLDRRSKKTLLPAESTNVLSQDESDLLSYEEPQHVLPKDDRNREFDAINPDTRLWSDLRINSTPQPLFPTMYPNPFDPLHPTIPGGQQFRWRASQRSFDTGKQHVALQRVRSAPGHQFPSLKRTRRSHGPAVSSAWPSSGTSRGGKPRGRPTGNRGLAEPAYSTFPASPSSLETQLSDQGIDLSLGAELPSTPTAIEEQLHFSSEAHQTILPPIIQALEDIYDHNVEIPPLLDRYDLRNDFHAHPFNSYGVIEKLGMVKEQLAAHIGLLARPQDNMNTDTARAIANSLIDGIIQASHNRGNESAFLRPLSLLLGLDTLEMQDLEITKKPHSNVPISDVQQLQKEMTLFERYRGIDDEEQSIHDLINTDDAASSPQTIQANLDQESDDLGSTVVGERYNLSWKLKLGPIEAFLSALVTPTTDPNRPPTSREEQRLRDEVEMLLSDIGTANPSPGSFPGSGSDLLLNDDIEPPMECAVDWRTKYFETREKLHKVEEELARLKQDLIARVMS
ncbi:hypothetical protein H072_3000 [Dactylellina haptotyla CBS 200.50]|uniref:Uncharacterized protein n=1 Tax=Dactylellina haptotyla (strain CBS 200.50) TaxID=1284197 RepID=S8AJA9_DACHA|nr:hypothetical protein H072_3000 [Dactylellina haptotyla CBS 200.50]